MNFEKNYDVAIIGGGLAAGVLSMKHDCVLCCQNGGFVICFCL